jgi:ubiquinone/menaquinone biosynthesis C-methylase UbiE
MKSRWHAPCQRPAADGRETGCRVPGPLVVPPLVRTDEPEWMDAPGHATAVLADNLSDLRRVNRWVGGVRLTLRGLQRLTAELPRGAALTIVDLATGGADIPRAVAAWARRREFAARVLATDLSPAILALAAGGPAGGSNGHKRGLAFAAADARRLPFADASVDYAICSLALHHQVPDDALAMLREMRRIAQRGVVVNDILRCWKGYWGARLITRLCCSNPLTRHDGPLSVRKAYTRVEMTALAAEAGLWPVTFDGFLGYRVAMTARLDW